MSFTANKKLPHTRIEVSGLLFEEVERYHAEFQTCTTPQEQHRIAFGNVKSVSYTHLDVYKRQALKKRVLLSATDAEEIPQFTGVGGGESSPQVVKLNFLSGEKMCIRDSLCGCGCHAENLSEQLQELFNQ